MNETLSRLAERRRNIFFNIVNGHEPEAVKQVFHLSDLELRNETQFVLRKINDMRWRRHTRGKPGGGVPFLCETYADFRAKRKELLKALDDLPDEHLASELFMPKITAAIIDPTDALALSDVQHRLECARAA